MSGSPPPSPDGGVDTDMLRNFTAIREEMQGSLRQLGKPDFATVSFESSNPEESSALEDVLPALHTQILKLIRQGKCHSTMTNAEFKLAFQRIYEPFTTSDIALSLCDAIISNKTSYKSFWNEVDAIVTQTATLNSVAQRLIALPESRIPSSATGPTPPLSSPATQSIRARTPRPSSPATPSATELFPATFSPVTPSAQRVAAAHAASPSKVTPVKPSTAHLSNTLENKTNISKMLIDEVKDDTYLNVEGFFEKHFKNQEKRAVVEELAANVKRDLYKGEHWITCATSTTQDVMVKFVRSLQAKMPLDTSYSDYNTIERPSQLNDNNARVQLDLFLTLRDKTQVFRHQQEPTDETEAQVEPVSPDGEKYDFADVSVVGELKSALNKLNQASMTQLLRYVREVFRHQPARHFVHGFLLCAKEIRLMTVDRSGICAMAAFDIDKDPDRFAQIMLGYAMMTPKELGFDDFFIPRDGKLQVEFPDNPDNAVPRVFDVDPKPLCYTAALPTRGTTCYHITDIKTQERFVMKLAWQTPQTKSERELFQQAQDAGVVGLTNMVAFHENVKISDLRAGLELGTKHRSRSIRRTTGSVSSIRTPKDSNSSLKRKENGQEYSSSSKRRQVLSLGAGSSGIPGAKSSPVTADPDGTIKQAENVTDQNVPAEDKQELHDLKNIDRLPTEFQDRQLTFLVFSPPGRPLKSFKTDLELCESLCDAIKAHYSLYYTGKILHRDISDNNIIIVDNPTDGDPRDRLIDLDMALCMSDERSGRDHITGTVHFMAIGVLKGHKHKYRHDLESFYWVLFWSCLRNRCGDEVNRLLDAWCWEANNVTPGTLKVGYVINEGFEDLLNLIPEYLSEFRKLIEDFRKILFFPPGFPPEKYPITGEHPNSSGGVRGLFTRVVQAFTETADRIRRSGVSEVPSLQPAERSKKNITMVLEPPSPLL